MKTQYYTATSLDGFIADADNSLAWLLQFKVPESDYASFIRDVGAVAMGSTTYEWVLANDLLKDPANPKPWPYRQPSWVFTTRDLPRLEGADVRFVRGDVRPVHRAMVAAAAGKNLWIVGGGDLAGQFLDHGLLDELIVQIAPVTLGAGAPLLPRAITAPHLRLVSAETVGEVFVQVVYEVPRREARAGPEAAG